MNKNLIFIISLFILPLPGMGVDAFAPSLPAVTAYFHTSSFLAQLAIPCYTIGYAVSMLFTGIIIDIYGTKKLTIGSLLVFAVLAILMIFAPNIETLIVMRVIQGLSVGFFAVAIRAIIMSLYAHDKELLKSKVNIMQIAWSMGPILAPAIGGYLGHHFGWQSSFIMMASYAIIMAILVTLIISDSQTVRKNVNLAEIKQSYVTILGSYHFLLGVTAMGMLYAVAVSFNTVGSFIIQNTLHMSAITFGYCSLMLGIAWLSGSMANKIIKAYSFEEKAILAAIAIIIISIITVIVTHYLLNIWTLMAAAILLNIFAGMVYSGLYCMTIARFSHIPGNSAGLMSSGILFGCALATTTMSKVVPHNQVMPFIHGDILLNLVSVGVVAILFYPQMKTLKYKLEHRF
jgi:MFS family permease